MPHSFTRGCIRSVWAWSDVISFVNLVASAPSNGESLKEEEEEPGDNEGASSGGRDGLADGAAV